MSVFRRNKKEAGLILFFTAVKFLLHLLANSQFGFHRDELLYIALGDHLAWGFREVPPFIAFISWLSTHIFGDSVFAVRLIPSLFGALTLYFTGMIALAMGGKRFAISVACLGMLLSPAFLASQYLLQPVVFDQFFWVLSAYLLLKYVQTKHISYLYWLGPALGLGMLNKYTMALYALGLFTALLLSAQRKVLWNRHVLLSLLISVLVFSPNLLWQVNHNFAALKHMRELNARQLDFINPADFLLQQVLIHFTGLFIWLPGLVYLFFSRVRGKYLFLSIAFLITIFLLTLLHGKVYYGFGAYPALFAAGGLCWQKILSRLSEKSRYAVLAVCIVPPLLLVPMAVPILPFRYALNFFEFTSRKMGLKFPLKWEDQHYHATTQDYADMLGWEEMADNVQKAYSMLSPDERNTTTILAGNYGMAGAIDHLGKKYNLPKVVCLNSSYMLWAPEKIQTKHIIYVNDEASIVLPAYQTVKKIGEVTNPYARQKGMAIYLLSDPVTDLNIKYKAELDRKRR